MQSDLNIVKCELSEYIKLNSIFMKTRFLFAIDLFGSFNVFNIEKKSKVEFYALDMGLRHVELYDHLAIAVGWDTKDHETVSVYDLKQPDPHSFNCNKKIKSIFSQNIRGNYSEFVFMQMDRGCLFLGMQDGTVRVLDFNLVGSSFGHKFPFLDKWTPKKKQRENCTVQ